MKTILITGADGFLGTYISQEFKKELLNDVQTVKTDKNILDVNSFGNCLDFIQKTSPDLVIHLAALCGAKPSIENPYEFYKTNTFGLLNILESMRICGKKKLIFASSLTVFGENTNKTIDLDNREYHARHPYANSKILAEQLIKGYCDTYDFKIIILRPTLVVGPGCKELHAIGNFIQQVLNDNKITIFGNGSHERDFIHPQDVASAFVLAAKKLDCETIKFPETFNLSNGEKISMKDLANMIISIHNKGELVFENTNSQTFSLFTSIDISQSKLDWKPTVNLKSIVSEMYNLLNN